MGSRILGPLGSAPAKLDRSRFAGRIVYPNSHGALSRSSAPVWEESQMSNGDNDQADNADQVPNGGPAQPPNGDGVGNGGQKPPAENGRSGSASPEPPIGDADVLVTDKIRIEVKDALDLADFVIKTGVKKADGPTVGPEVVKVIKVTAGKIRLYEEIKDAVYIKASEWARFELAYYALADFSSAVTAETLHNTQNTGQGYFRQSSPAQKFTWLLWAITIGFATFVVLAAAIVIGGIDTAPANWWTGLAQPLSQYIQILIPYAYGGLGACAFLLRSAHSMIAQRRFDIRRKPEYLNRILLGMVSGGAIVLLINQDSEGETVRISSAALGFIAGYSNDFLFNAIERVVAAVLPHVGLESVQRASAPARPPLELPTGGMTLKELMDRMEKASPEDKELYKSLIAKLRDRL
jgi:hypothetical protein